MWGWEPRETHTHEYDDAGRLVRTVVEREPEWDGESYALMAALAEVEHTACSGCGEPLEESMSPDADPDNREGTHRYEVGAPYRCFACDARERKVREFADAGGQVTQALRWPVTRVERRSGG